MSIDLNAFTIREARPADDHALRRLAELDDTRAPSGRVMIGELDGEPVAAVPIAGGPAIADPFRSTSALVSLLGLRAAQLRGLEDGRSARARIRQLIPAVAARRRQTSTTPEATKITEILSRVRPHTPAKSRRSRGRKRASAVRGRHDPMPRIRYY